MDENQQTSSGLNDDDGRGPEEKRFKLNEAGRNEFSMSDGALQRKSKFPAPSNQQSSPFPIFDLNLRHNLNRTPSNPSSAGKSAKSELIPKIRYLPFSVESRKEFLKSIKTLNLPSDESANYNRLEEEIKKIDDAKKNISEMQNHFENSWNALMENGLTISNDFAFYRIPNTNWIFVRPLQMPTKCKGFHLPVIPEEQYFFYNVKSSKKFVWNALPTKENMEKSKELENSMNGIDLLIKEDYQHLVCYKEKLLSLIFKLACSNRESSHLAAIHELNESDSIGRNYEKTVDAFFRENSSQEKLVGSVYLLMDPRKFGAKIPERNKIGFHDFINSIFYIGETKNKDSRPIDYLIRTKNSVNFGNSFKRGRISEIWNANHGVVVLSIFSQISKAEAEFREVCMIEARLMIGFPEEKNPNWSKIAFSSYDLVNKDKGKSAEFILRNPILQKIDKCALGCRLLLKAYSIFQVERLLEIERSNLPNSTQSIEESPKLSGGSPTSLLFRGYFTPVKMEEQERDVNLESSDEE